MLQHRDDDFSDSYEENSAFPTSSSDASEARTDHSTSDSMVTIESTDTFPRSEDATAAHSSVSKCETIENQNTADELKKMESSESAGSSLHPPLSKNSHNSTSPQSSKMLEAFNLSIEDANQTDVQAEKFPFSPKRRHPSSKDEPDFKKLNTSAEMNLTKFGSSSGEEAKATFRPTTVPSETVTEAVPQSMVVNPEACSLEQRTDFQGGSSASNKVDERFIFKMPAIPPLRERIKKANVLVSEHLLTLSVYKDNPILASMILGNQKQKLDFNVLLHGIGSDAPAESSQSVGDAPAESSQSVGDALAESSQSVGPSVTHSPFVPEIEAIVNEYLQREIPTWPPGGYDNAILRIFLTDFTSVIQEFRNLLTKSLTRLRSMVPSPYLNVSSLGITVNDLLYAAAQVEIVWQNYDQWREENSNSVTVMNVIEHYRQYIHCLYELMKIYSDYVANLPKDYPGKADS